jgi:solute:Na+ symporter, SSS family
MPHARLAALDLAIVAAYVLAMTALGVWFTTRQKDLRAYFVGGRDVGWFMVLVSIVATETSAVTFLSVPGLAYRDGGNFTFLQLAIGYILGRTAVAFLLLPGYMHGDIFSAYQVLREQFGTGVQRVASGLFLVTRTIADGLRLFLTALVMQYVGLSVPQAVLAVAFVTVVYTYLGGMKAVLWTDLIQFVIKIAGAALAFGFVIYRLPGGWEQFCAEAGALGKFRVFDLSTDLASDGTLWAGVIGGAVFSMASHGADQLMVQRYLCARNLAHARAALILSGITVFAQFVLFLLLGAGLHVLRKNGLFEAAGAKPDEAFGLFIVTQLPTGVVGILIAAILAAAMSTLSSSLNSSANAAVTDFYRPLRPGRNESHYVAVSRGMTAFFGVLQAGVAYVAVTAGGDVSVVKRVLAVAGFTTGLVLGLFVLGRLKPVVPGWAAVAGLLAGFAAVTAAWLPSTWNEPVLAWPWFAPLGCTVTVAVAVLLGRIFAVVPEPPRPQP